ncbi:hypothetical protein IK112_03140 [Candidatus Saccharibacteria bacterium]|nr:hypothetical protein [Candidatus Saccharibacteria bacterium]
MNKSNMNTKIKLAPGVAAAILLAGAVMPVAVAGATSKEEVVYVNTNAYGKVENIDVVNIFSLEHAGVIEDFGEYSSVRNMTTNDKVEIKDGKVSVNVNEAGKIYYDGKLISTQAPWNLSIKYYLDSEEKTAPEIAGASGKLKIVLKVTKNNSYAGPDFFDNYALQGTLQLDTTKAENIVSEIATVANVGQKKQLSYIALPGEGLDVTITADVKDFEMDGFSVNGIPLNLNVDVDDTELINKVNDLKSAVQRLDDGTGELNSGIKMLADGVNEVDSKLKELDSYSSQIAGGSAEMLAALKSVKESLPDATELATELQTLTGGADTLKDSLTGLSTGMSNVTAGYTIDSYKAQLKAALGDDAYNAWKDTPVAQFTAQYFATMTGSLNTISTNATAIKNGYETQLYVGINKLANTVSTLLTKLNNGVNKLISEYEKLNNGTNSYTDGLGKIVAGYQLLVNGTSSLTNGGNTLKNGTTEFRNETANLDTTVSNKINELIDSIKGKANIGSFSSSKNTDIKAVQFVMKTEKIEKPEIKVKKTEEPKQNKSFWEKFLDLFHF